jgi:outer membrane protein OmpA-like peptidoglycan-associated protein
MKRLDLFLGAAALLAVPLTASPAVMAQENGNRDENGKVVRGPYETNRFGDNWFIGAGGGINVFWSEGLDAENLKIAPSIDFNFGKWFTPAVGMRLGYQGINSQVWSDTPTLLGPARDADSKMYLEKFGYMYVHGDFLWNMSDALGGYKQTRFWNFVPYLHAGYFRTYGLDNVEFSDNEIAAGAGLLHNLRLVERLDLIVDMRATVVNARVRGASGVAVLPTVTMGLAVDLGWPSFVRTSTVLGEFEAISVDQIAALEAAALALEIANESLQEDNAMLKVSNGKLNKEVKNLKSKLSESAFSETEFFDEMGPAVVFFNIGKAVLDDKEMMHMDFIANNILTKVDQDTKIHITVAGTADGTTGTLKRNQYLSKARGEYVMNLLTKKYGISPDRIVLHPEVISKPADPALSRTVTITF